MPNHLTLDVDKIYKKYEMSINRDSGMMVDSNIRGLKYIVKDGSIISTTVKNGVFAIDMGRIEEFTQELLGIAELYGNN